MSLRSIQSCRRSQAYTRSEEVHECLTSSETSEILSKALTNRADTPNKVTRLLLLIGRTRKPFVRALALAFRKKTKTSMNKMCSTVRLILRTTVVASSPPYDQIRSRLV